MSLPEKLFLTGSVVAGTGVLVMWACLLLDIDIEGPAVPVSVGTVVAGFAFWPVAALVAIWGAAS